jgi:hypothetical protein
MLMEVNIGRIIILDFVCLFVWVRSGQLIGWFALFCWLVCWVAHVVVGLGSHPFGAGPGSIDLHLLVLSSKIHSNLLSYEGMDGDVDWQVELFHSLSLTNMMSNEMKFGRGASKKERKRWC